MARSRADEIIEGWKMVAHNVPRPGAEAPHPYQSRTRTAMPLGLAAAAAVAILVATLAFRGFGSNTQIPGTSASASTAPVSTATASATAPTATATPASLAPNPPAQAVPTFTTPGSTANWSGLSWTALPSGSPLKSIASIQVVQWSGGFTAFGQTTGSKAFVWTSPDGESWRAIDQISGTDVEVAPSPNGLVAIVSTDASSPSQTVWSSADGVNWTNMGTTKGAATLTSLAGSRSGLLAVSTTSEIAKGTGSDVSIVRSTDGVNWTAVTVEPGLKFDSSGARVQAGGGTFFVMGTPATAGARTSGLTLMVSGNVAAGVVWWSPDGQTWTRSTGTLTGSPRSLDFAGAGILLHTNTMATPGGLGLYRSTDGGKTWVADANFGPLGQEPCTGECTIGPDGVFAGNGTVFVAVKNDGHAWTSTDGATWKAISWSGGPTPPLGMVVFPRGILLNGSWGAAK